jgi:hypothetical protein
MRIIWKNILRITMLAAQLISDTDRKESMSAHKVIYSELEEVLHNWVSWMRTRKYYAAPVPHNMLAGMMMDRAYREPHDHKNDAMSSAWNMVMSSSKELEPESYYPFLYVYLKEHRPAPVKALAYELGIDADTVYQRAHNAAPRYLRQAKHLHALNAKMVKDFNADYD